MSLFEYPVKIKKEHVKYHAYHPEAKVPQAWSKAPIFAAVPQSSPREVVLSDGTVWTMGIKAPHSNNVEYQRALDIRHAEVIFSLISFFRSNGLQYNDQIDVSYRQLLQIVNWPKCDTNLKKLKDILGDLENIWTQISDGKTNLKFKILASITLEENAETKAERLRFLVFDKTFMQFIEAFEKTQNIQLDVLNSIRSDIAKALYLYLPSRAVKNTKNSPFKITLTKVFEQIGAVVPQHKSKRKQRFTQNNNSVLNQLDNTRLQFNTKLRVCLEETKNKKDYNLCAWPEPLKDTEVQDRDSTSKLFVWFIDGNNGTAEDFYKKIVKMPALNIYEKGKLQNCGIDIIQNEKFLRMSKALMGEFTELCGELVDKVHTSPTGIRNPLFYFIGLIRRNLTGDFLFNNQ